MTRRELSVPPWWRTIGPDAWRALVAAKLGWMLDAMDVMLYAFALTAIQSEFSLTSAQSGALASVTLVASAAGGAACGVLADRYGRARMLIVSILVYSLFTGATAFATSVATLALARTLVGLGLGAEWSAGSVLVAETWPAEHRGKAIGIMQSGWAIGYILAAVLAALVLPRFGWRALFLAGIAPALLTVWIRRRVPEPAIWQEARAAGGGGGFGALLRPPLRARMVAATAVTTALLFAYWGLFTWIPAFLASPVERGGAGLGVVRSLGFIVPMQVGAFFGYILFGLLADRLDGVRSSWSSCSPPPPWCRSTGSSGATRSCSSSSARSLASSATATSACSERCSPSCSPPESAPRRRGSATTRGAPSARWLRSRSAPSRIAGGWGWRWRSAPRSTCSEPC